MFRSVTTMKQLTMILVVLIIMLLVGCQPAEQTKPTDIPDVGITEAPQELENEQPEDTVEITEPPSPEPTAVPIPTVNVPDITVPEYECESEYTKSEFTANMHGSTFFVDGQIILIGDPEYIRNTVSELDWIFPPESEPISYGDVIYQVVLTGSVVIELYELEPGISVEDAVKIVNDDYEDVFAEPNYIITNPLTGYGRGGGSGIVGDPSDYPESANASLAQGKFLFSNQWAFWEKASIIYSNSEQDASIGQYDSDGNRIPDIAPESDVEVAIFDTVPGPFLEKNNNKINWAVTPFSLCVWKPGLMINTDQNQTSERGLQDHGLFATGLAQGIAPSAQYYLIEVLNADATGDLFSLLRAMDLYTKQRGDSEKENGKQLTNTVINLSLGLAIEKEKKRNGIGDELMNLVEQLRAKAERLGYVPDSDIVEEFPVASLYLAIEYFHNNGAVIVGASGNDGSDWIQTPAAFPEVIGVASSNVKRSKSCFSNFGNLAAPGGDGCSDQELSACDDNAGGSGCDPLVVVSLIYTDTRASETNPSLYAYWRGTSFSAPMVSGLTALVFDATSDKSAAEIQEILYCSTDTDPEVDPSLGAGVIDVQKALSAECIR